MEYLKVHSDYAPDTYMKLVRTDDGDVIFKICGKGEMRIATSGGQFHGRKLVAITEAVNSLIDALSMDQNNEEETDDSPCAGCCHRGCCGTMLFDTSGMSEEEIFREHCVGCPCGDCFECNRESGCDNYEETPS